MLTQNERSKILHNAMRTWNKQKMKIYQKCKRQNGGCQRLGDGESRMRGYCLMAIELQFYKIKIVMEMVW